MSCPTCNNNNPSQVYVLQTTYPTSCIPNECGNGLLSSKCVYYAGPNLPCSGINSNDSIELSLQKIDTQICEITGNYGDYNTYCLAPIETQQEFVETISNYVCTTRTMLNTFTGTTFINYQDEVNDRFLAIEQPGITCSFAGVTNFDAIQSVLTKYCGAFNTINTYTSLSGVNWSQCFTVTPAPTNISQAFSVVLDLICQVNNNGTVLPTFNNVGSCLPSPGANDSLVDTINKVKSRLCQTGTFDTTTLTWGCSIAQTSLQSTIQLLLNGLTDWKQNKPTYSEDFVITQVDEGDRCQGVLISLATPIEGNDRLVATSVTDTTPGTLVTKVVGSSKISVTEIGSNPSKQIQLTTSAIDQVTTSNTSSVTFSGLGTIGSPLSATVTFPTSTQTLQQTTTLGNTSTNSIIINRSVSGAISDGTTASLSSLLYVPNSNFGSNNMYGSVGTLNLNLTSAVLTGDSSFNRTAVMGSLVVSGNNTTPSSARFSMIRAAASFTNTLLTDVCGFNSRTPELYSSNTISNYYSVYIEPVASTGISNAWGIYQEGVGDKNFYAGKTIYDSTISLTPGNVTINKPSGKVIIDNLATSITVTNSFVTTDSIVIAVPQTFIPSTAAYIKAVVPNNGSFTIYFNAIPEDGDITIGWVVYN